MSDTTSSPSNTRSRRLRQVERCQEWRKKQNALVMADEDRKREERFKNIGLYSSVNEAQFHRADPVDAAVNISDASCECDSLYDETSVTIPLPISTIPLNNLATHFYNSMSSIVEDINSVCTFDQFIRTTHLQLLNRITPPIDTTATLPDHDVDSGTLSDHEESEIQNKDVTSQSVQLPNAIAAFIDSAKPFSIPVEKVPNGAIIRVGGSSTTVKEVIFKPEIVKATDFDAPENIRSRYYSIYDYTQPGVDLMVCDRVVEGSILTYSDAAATAKLLAHIPHDCDNSWKIDGNRFSGSPEMHYLVYGPTVRFTSPSEYNIREPPPPQCYVNLRLFTGFDVTNTHMKLYQLFRECAQAPRIFEQFFRRMMERSKVQKVFKDLRRIPLNNDCSLFLRY